MVKQALLGGTVLAGQPVEIWFQDEARVGQKGGHAYIWAEKGARPLMVRDNRHESAYLFGAICPVRGVGAAIIMPAVNTEAMNEHLKEISAQVAQGAHAVLIVDGAGGTASPSLPPADRFAMAPDQRKADRARQHHAPVASALRAGTEPDGKRLGIPARQQTVRPRVGHIRRYRSSLPKRLAVPGR
jgi:hypothetical protein